MDRSFYAVKLQDLFEHQIVVDENFLVFDKVSEFTRQNHTNEVFTEKWKRYDDSDEKSRLIDFQKQWFLKLYGFESEAQLSDFLLSKPVIFDAGCGLGYKAAWFAKLAPSSLVIGMDFSDAAAQAAFAYQQIENLFFVKGDIANSHFRSGVCDFTCCDQVIMHTENPAETFAELARITSATNGEFACYFYSKKALPRELLDTYFREQCMNFTQEKLWEFSEQVTELGRRLDEIDLSFECPDIPLLGIKGGQTTIQRFVYWNFIKCFWNSNLGPETSIITNFDWYSPSNAQRFSQEEIEEMVHNEGMVKTFFHTEPACFSGRFRHD